MGRMRNTIYLDRDVDTALRDWADRKGYSMSEASNILLRRALFDSLDEGTQAMLVPEISRAVREAAGREVRETVSWLLGVQTDRLFGVLVANGRDAYISRKLARDLLEESAGSTQWANEREQDALLRARRRYTREGLKTDEASHIPHLEIGHFGFCFAAGLHHKYVSGRLIASNRRL